MTHKPRIRVLPDEDGLHYRGLFDGGYSSVGRVSARTLSQALAFYRKVLDADKNAYLWRTNPRAAAAEAAGHPFAHVGVE